MFREKYTDDFERIARGNRTLYIKKGLQNRSLIHTLLVGETFFKQTFEPIQVASSDFSRVGYFFADIGSQRQKIYIKKHLNRSVWDFIKHIFRKNRARRAFEASLMLKKNGFDTPAVVGLLETRSIGLHSNNLLLTENVDNSLLLCEILTNFVNKNDKETLRQKRKLITAFGRMVGKMHASGIFHGDLRLGNVLVCNEMKFRFFFIDNERTIKLPRLPQWLRLKNLVQINMFRDGISNADRLRFFKAYCEANPDIYWFRRKWVKLVAGRTAKRLLRKASKTTETNVKIVSSGYIGTFDEQFLGGGKDTTIIASELMGKIDSLMDTGTIMKKDITTYVSRFKFNSRNVVVKRYNYKGIIHSLRHTFKGSRAKRCWLNGYKLRELGIDTPLPLAFIEKRIGPIVLQSYIVTEYADGVNLYDFLRQADLSEHRKNEVLSGISRILERLEENRITHGDLKFSNIIVAGNKLILLDLDSLKFHCLGLFYRHHRAKDVRRFENI